MHARLFSRVTRVVLTVLLLAASAQLAAAAARPEPGTRRARRGFDLMAGPFQYFLVNRVYCGINSLGEFCVDPTNSPSIPGGYWPRGTPNQYIFNSGLQLAGIVDPAAGFGWAGDTVGAFFIDFRGDQAVGEAIIPLHSSLDAADVAAWPNGGIVRDTAIYAEALVYDKAGQLLNRPSVSQQDIWGRAWDGNPNLGAGREHPMGILTDTRAMAWSFPSGNEDILYFVFDFYNITASDRAVYNSLDPAIQDEIAAIGQQYQDNVQSVLGVDIPAAGYTITEAYAAFGMDPDVDDAGSNNSTAILPFSLAAAYKTDWFSATGFAYPPDVHGPPFAAAPGFVGVKYLKSPADPNTGLEYGLTMFSNTANRGDGFPDATGVIQLWRYLSGRVNTAAGDNPCTVANPVQDRLCFLDQIATDTRFYQSSGPFTLDPGQKFTIVVAYVHAAAVADEITIGTNMAPGIPPSPTALASGTTERPIDRAAGWISHSDVNGNGRIEQTEVQTLPRSLLNKSLVAQEVYGKKFLLPAPPEAPNFFLVPGNNQITVVWEPSATETTGDPFYGIASDPASALFDPNFRQFDVEGYRIYRGRSQSRLNLIAEFDYDGTYFRDYTGGVHTGGSCAPELGVFDDCAETFDFPISNTGPYHDYDIVGELVQVPAGGRVQLADGSVLVLKEDVAGVTGVTTPVRMENTGVPFAFLDRSVINSVTYVYAVTAFDVNSVNSGPTVLESPQILRTGVPRGPAPGQTIAGELQPQKLLAPDGTELDPTAPLPTIDPATAVFSGPMPPTDGIEVGLATFIPDLLPADGGTITVSIDSIKPGYADGLGNGAVSRPVVYYLTGQGSGDPVQFTVSVQQEAFDAIEEGSGNFPATNVDSARASLYLGGRESAFIPGKVTVHVAGDYQLATGSRAAANQSPAGASEESQPRWWAGDANENTPNPTSGGCLPWNASCGAASAPLPDITLTAGRLPGVDTLFHIAAYTTVASRPARDYDAMLAGVVRAADFAVYWGAGGTVDSVFDLTHKVTVPFQADIGPSWGILNASGFAGTNEALTPDQANSVLTWADYLCVAPGPAYMAGVSTLTCGGAAQTPAVLSPTAELSPIAPRSSAGSAAGVQALAASVTSTTGFMFYLNGHFFVMSMSAVPAAGTVWNARFFSGNITGPAVNAEYGFIGATRPPAVPGLRVVVEYTGSRLDYSATQDSSLERIHTVPDPYYVTNNMELSTNRKILKFVNLPAQAIIRIYSLSGVLVDIVEHLDPTGGGEATWDLRNRNNQFVASGVYFYHVETPDGKQRIGRFTVVNFAQ